MTAMLSISTDSENEVEWFLDQNSIGLETIIQVFEQGLYNAVVSNPSGCSDTLRFQLTSTMDVPQIMIEVPDTINCKMENVDLQAEVQNTESLRWHNENGDLLSMETVIKVEEEGSYFLTAISADGCEISDSVTVFVDRELPDIVVEDITLNCVNVFAFLEFESAALQDSISWTGENFVSDKYNPEIQLGGKYDLVVYAENGCSSTADIEVTLDTFPPSLTVESADIHCSNKVISLIVTNVDPNVLYSATDSEGNEIALNADTISRAGSYLVIAEGLNGCTVSEQILIAEEPSIAAVDFDLKVGTCTATGVLENINIQGGTAQYTFLVDDVPFDFSDAVPLDGAGTHSIQVIDAHGCVWDTLVITPELVLPELNLPDQIELTIGQSYEINAMINIPESDIAVISWMPEDNLSCNDCLNPIWQGDFEENLAIELIDINGCSATANIRIRLLNDLINDFKVYIPNVLTPNSRDQNAGFTLFTELEKVKEIQSMLIYDRWGNQVFAGADFSPNDISLGWNGSYNNEDALQGTYVYIITLILINDDTKTFVGDLALLR